MERLFFILIFCFPIYVFSKPVDFVLKTTDGLTSISGQVDVPDCGAVNYPAVVIVGGTGLFSRNGYFGSSGTEKDFLFSTLARNLNANCIAAVRFDYRGVKCDIKSPTDVTNCLDQNDRSHVSDETILDDIQTVYDYALKQNYISNDKIILLGHSEGSLNISRLVARGSIFPTGILFFGGLTESAHDILHWQLAVRPVDWAFEMDTDRNGLLTNFEVTTGFDHSKLKGVFPVGDLISPDGEWTRAKLDQAFESKFDSYKNTFLAVPDAEPYLINGAIYSSYKWWKRWFVDKVPVLENLKNFVGPIEYHNGDIDSQTPGLRELNFLNTSTIAMKSKPNFVVHVGKGHGLGPEALLGPMDENIADKLVETVRRWAFGP